MRTGRYRFQTTYTQRRWFKPPRPVKVLMVEVDEPIDQGGNRATFWRPADECDVADYEGAQVKLRVECENLAAERSRYRARLDAIAATASRL